MVLRNPTTATSSESLSLLFEEGPEEQLLLDEVQPSLDEPEIESLSLEVSLLISLVFLHLPARRVVEGCKAKTQSEFWRKARPC